MDGIINFFKPEGMTSHDAVYFFRKLLKTKKIGHTGTLDPMATGVLPICIEKGTKVSDYLSSVDKEYIAELTLGTMTDTQDSTGAIIKTSNIEVTQKDIVDTINSYVGEILQLPPMYSAKKINGRKLYDLARKGIEVERKPNKINIRSIEILKITNNNKILFKVLCSKGTYIRTLCNDIGEDLGTYGHMSYLLRSRVADYNVEASYGIDTLRSMEIEDVYKLIQPVDSALSHLNKLDFNSNYLKPLSNGVKIEIQKNDGLMYNTPIRIYVDSDFLGIGKIYTDNDYIMLKMEKVFKR